MMSRWIRGPKRLTEKRLRHFDQYEHNCFDLPNTAFVDECKPRFLLPFCITKSTFIIQLFFIFFSFHFFFYFKKKYLNTHTHIRTPYIGKHIVETHQICVFNGFYCSSSGQTHCSMHYVRVFKYNIIH